ncbi:class I SAM-dependent methyltransferase [Pacificoceanicola onchidii]|uniref:class I SAM-dependent methyltransferase n=1 Tax=Pacificoceanicola onchidii TaxID=2562685 RepID=UPI0010A63C6E|nr:class I SAM-dependent methyltransferase [Pacificoceanicola onchidii]
MAELDPDDHLSQVGHTVHGQPIPEDHLLALQAQMAAELQIGHSDRLLDLCCGNGIFTRPLSEQAEAALGVDFSSAMLSVARRDFPGPNLRYEELDVSDIASLSDRPEAPFSRVMMYGAWQHFDLGVGQRILEDVLSISSDDLRIVLGFVPDFDLKHNFFDTPERRAAHEAYVAAGTDAFGNWWKKDELVTIAGDLGLTCEFTDLPAKVHAARYRFNATLVRG